MPYIGNTAANRFVASKAASVYSGDGSTTAFTLEHSVGADEDILVSVDGVIQEPSVAYAVSSGTTLTFTAAPSSNSGNNIFVYYLFRTVGTIDHPATSALSATSGTFSTNATIAGTLGVTGATSLTAQTDTGVVKFRTATAPTFDQNSYIYGESGFGMNIESSAVKFNVGSSRVETMRIDANGHVTKPLQPAFHAQPASLQSNIAVNTDVTVVYGTETYDVGSNFASNTFTAPVTGKYLLCYSLYLQTLDTAANYYEAYINSSNRDYYASTIDPDFGDADWNYFSLTGSSIVDMDANDTAKIILKQSTGTAQSDINTPSFFSGALIC